ncbi:MAG TPA: amino acid adenylation domain-containing protein, partial [Puia sp.]|uniref:amino acid adenylation domain-containing protein n=1 Tax=Puia sp. TaxID=2045100 RepID=UPI002BA6CF89
MKINDTLELVHAAKKLGIDISLQEDQLQLRVPEGMEVDEGLLSRIRISKESIVQFLRNEHFQLKKDDDRQLPILRQKGGAGRYPLSFSQERLWFVDQKEGSRAYHLPSVLRLRGHLERNILEDSLRKLVVRHEILRTVIRQENGVPYQEVIPADDWRMTVTEVPADPGDPALLEQRIIGLIDEPFRMAADYMLRCRLICIGEQEHILVLVLHHIAADGWSVGILINELTSLYSAAVTGRPADLQPLPIQYRDYAAWQRASCSGEVFDGKVLYWRQQLKGMPVFHLPPEHQLPETAGQPGGIVSARAEEHVTSALQMLSRQEQVTQYMLLLSVFKVLLFRHTGAEDIGVGSSVAGRQRHETERIIGFFSNTLVIRSSLRAGMCFRELLHQVKQTTLDALENQEVPFGKIVEALGIRREAGRAPLFGIMFVLENAPGGEGTLVPGLRMEPETFEKIVPKFDLTIALSGINRELTIDIVYRRELYSRYAMEGLLNHYMNLLGRVSGDLDKAIDELELMDETERRRLAEVFPVGDWETAAGEKRFRKWTTVVGRWNEQVRRSPEATALVYGDTRLSYRELNRRSNQLGRYLRRKGVGKDRLVPMVLEAGIDSLIAIWGILKAGGVYVPVDPANPADRMQYILEDICPGVLICSSRMRDGVATIVVGHPQLNDLQLIDLHLEDAVISLESDADMDMEPGAEAGAYVIYTSGSTGRPKGVLIDHRSLLDYAEGLEQMANTGKCRSFALVSTLSADLGNTSIYGALLSGAALHLFPQGMLSDARALREYFEREQIECLKIVPSHWAALSSGHDLLLPNKLLIFGGEALNGHVAEMIAASGGSCSIVNHYGPTETTIGKLLHVVRTDRSHSGRVPVGKPFPGTRVYVLNEMSRLCPVGAPGELYISGPGLARGYINQPEMTGDRFVNNPYGSGEWALSYKTGDRVRWLPDGSIEYIGRMDDQVKIRGYRVEPGEIESMLKEYDPALRLVVAARQREHGGQELVVYLAGSDVFDASEMKAYLRMRLPEYMIPARIIRVKELPLTGNGKLDRIALAGITEEGVDAASYEEPRTEAEIRMTAIWKTLLGLERIGLEDDFFQSGGHSLLAIRLITAMRDQLQMEISIGELFDHPTISSLLAFWSGRERMVQEPLTPIARTTSRMPLSYSQERLWFIDRLEGTVAYHNPMALQLPGDIDPAAMERAFQALIRRHEVLRTMIGQEAGVPYQWIAEDYSWALGIIEGGGYEEGGAPLEALLLSLTRQPFDLAVDCKLRAQLVTLQNGGWILLVVLHHIATDGWSNTILVNELMELYNAGVAGRPPGLLPLPLQYADYAIWQRNHLKGEVLAGKLGYWKSRLTGVLPLELPT